MNERSITLERESEGVYVARNAAGAELRFGFNVPGSFSAVELLLVAIAGCSAVDLDLMTSRRSEPDRFVVTASGTRAPDGEPAFLSDIVARFDVAFPEGEDGDKARARIEPALRAAHERTCTVSRTVSLGSPVTLTTAPTNS